MKLSPYAYNNFRLVFIMRTGELWKNFILQYIINDIFKFKFNMSVQKLYFCNSLNYTSFEKGVIFKYQHITNAGRNGHDVKKSSPLFCFEAGFFFHSTTSKKERIS